MCGLGPDLAEAHEIVVGLPRAWRFEVGGEVADVVEDLLHLSRDLGRKVVGDWPHGFEGEDAGPVENRVAAGGDLEGGWAGAVEGVDEIEPGGRGQIWGNGVIEK